MVSDQYRLCLLRTHVGSRNWNGSHGNCRWMVAISVANLNKQTNKQFLMRLDKITRCNSACCTKQQDMHMLSSQTKKNKQKKVRGATPMAKHNNASWGLKQYLCNLKQIAGTTSSPCNANLYNRAKRLFVKQKDIEQVQMCQIAENMGCFSSRGVTIDRRCDIVEGK